MITVKEKQVHLTIVSEVLVMKADGGKRASSPVESGCLWLLRNTSDWFVVSAVDFMFIIQYCAARGEEIKRLLYIEWSLEQRFTMSSLIMVVTAGPEESKNKLLV